MISFQEEPNKQIKQTNNKTKEDLMFYKKTLKVCWSAFNNSGEQKDHGENYP